MKTELVEVRGINLASVKEGEKVFVFIKPICEALGIGLEFQTRKIKENRILSEFAEMRYLSDKQNRSQLSMVLPIHLLSGWLFSLQGERIEESKQELFLAFQRECYQALFNHFFGSYRNVRQNHSLLGELKRQHRDCLDTIKHNKAKAKVLERQIEALLRDNCTQLGIDWDEAKNDVELAETVE